MTRRLVKVAKEFKIGTGVIVDLLARHGYEIDHKPTSKITEEMYELIILEAANLQNRNVLKKKKKTNPVQDLDNGRSSSTTENSNPLSVQKSFKDESQLKKDKSSSKNNSKSQNKLKITSNVSKSTKILSQKENTKFKPIGLSDEKIRIAEKNIVGRPIYVVANMLDIEPNKIIKEIGLKYSLQAKKYRISRKTWNSHSLFFATTYFKRIKYIQRSINRGNNHKKKNWVYKDFYVYKRRIEIFGKKHTYKDAANSMRLEQEKKRELKRKKMIIKFKESNKSGPIETKRQPHIIYIGHPKY